MKERYKEIVKQKLGSQMNIPTKPKVCTRIHIVFYIEITVLKNLQKISQKQL